MIDEKQIARIKQKLISIEKEKNVKVLYAVESGSRAWGFESTDSDYDVRFIYIHPVDWYLSINEKRDVIEYPIDDDLIDISGWEIRKALRLFRKSNPPLMEWLRSPIVYYKYSSFIDKIHQLENAIFSPKACIYHYLHMAEGNFKEYLRKKIVWVKKYFYVLRPVLACEWIERTGEMAPMEFEKIFSQIEDNELRNEITKILKLKRAGEELDEGPIIPIINDYLNDRINYFKNYVKNIDKKKNINILLLDDLFRSVLNEI